MAPILNYSAHTLPNNTFYNNYFPKFIISLSALYILSFLTICLIRKCRRFREEKKQQEKKLLKLTWQESMKKYQLKDSLLFNEKIGFPQSTYNKSSCNTSTSSSTLNNITPPFISSSTTFQGSGHNPLIIESPKGYPHVNKNKEAIVGDLIQVRLVQEQCSRRNKNYWISNTKKLTLLWHWSVSMGYIEYDHGKDLNALIMKLSKVHQHGNAENPLMDKENVT